MEFHNPTSVNRFKFGLTVTPLGRHKSQHHYIAVLSLGRVLLVKFTFEKSVDRQIEWLVELCHISRDIDDRYVCFFKGVEYSCSHLISKDVHDG